jgi:hypothetical protein
MRKAIDDDDRTVNAHSYALPGRTSTSSHDESEPGGSTAKGRHAYVEWSPNHHQSVFCVQSRFPLSSQWSGALLGRSVVRGRTGYTTGQANLLYQPLPSTSLQCCVRMAEDEPCGDIGVETHGLACTLSSNRLLTVAASRDFKLVSVRGTVNSQRQLNVFLDSRTRHNWKLAFSPSRIAFAVRPTLQNNRLVQVFGSYTLLQHESWTAGFWLGQSLETTRVGAGLTQSASHLKWVLSFSRDGLTLCIPLVLSLTNDPFWFPVQVLSMTLLSQVVTEMLSKVLSFSPSSQATQPKFTDSSNVDKNTALQQQVLMERQAKQRMLQETKNGGLVIQRGLYYNGTASLDVTIPLQFWVTNSALHLPATSKAHLLGFCTLELPALETTPGSFWTGFFAKDMSKQTAILLVEYKHADKLHQVTIADNQQLSLPVVGR